MSNSVRLTWPDRASHPNSRGHWSKRAKANKAMRKAAYYLTLGANVKAPENGDIRVVLTFYPPDRRQGDRDNLLSNCKAYLDGIADALGVNDSRSEEHTSELQSLMRISYAVFCLKKKKHITNIKDTTQQLTFTHSHNDIISQQLAITRQDSGPA